MRKKISNSFILFHLSLPSLFDIALNRLGLVLDMTLLFAIIILCSLGSRLNVLVCGIVKSINVGSWAGITPKANFYLSFIKKLKKSFKKNNI